MCVNPRVNRVIFGRLRVDAFTLRNGADVLHKAQCDADAQRCVGCGARVDDAGFA
jgi:hypothetical protein